MTAHHALVVDPHVGAAAVLLHRGRGGLDLLDLLAGDRAPGPGARPGPRRVLIPARRLVPRPIRAHL
jgi:hypothetical protein